MRSHLGTPQSAQADLMVEKLAHPTGKFGIYVHVPFCSSRCGYCDFNTYTPGELGTGASQQNYLTALGQEMRMAAELKAAAGDDRLVQTVFIGGGTPSMLGAGNLAKILGDIKKTFGLATNAEVTTESNPESTSPQFFDELRHAGFTRISLGMQSASAKVLRVLERAHTPGRPFAAAREARAAGFDHVNLDVIYGTPTETDSDLRETLDRVLDTDVDHVSAYSLIVEDGTRMARKVRKGELPAPDEDTYADRYAMVDETLTAAGFDWYEVSNWAKPGGECEHNLGYWRDDDWWGFGPGAHSHMSGQRFFTVKHPARYSALLAEGALPIQEVEQLSAEQRHEEKLLVGLRLKEGIPLALLSEREQRVAERFVNMGLLHHFIVADTPRIGLSKRGRLLADGMIADILFDA